jgi:hypothetical protein
LNPCRQRGRRRLRLGLTQDRKPPQRPKTHRPEGKQPQPHQQRNAHRATQPPQHTAPTPRLIDQDLRRSGRDAAHTSTTHARPEGWAQPIADGPPRRARRAAAGSKNGSGPLPPADRMPSGSTRWRGRRASPGPRFPRSKRPAS